MKIYYDRPDLERSELEKITYSYLDRLNIEYSRVDHDAAATIADCELVDGELGTKMCKNLFLCNSQKTTFYLLLMPGDKHFKTKEVSQALGIARLSFAPEEYLLSLMGLRPGAVTVLGLMNDEEKNVNLLIDKEFMVFTDDQAKAYRNDSTEPYASSSYSIDSTMTLEMPEVSKKYMIDKRSDNHIRLYESAETYMYLIRYPNADMSEITIDTAVVTGKWNVVYRDTDSPIADEYLVFENGQMHDYRGNGETPAATMDYVWDGNQIIISTINKTMTLHIISDTKIAFIETDTGFIWELGKAE